MTIFIREKVNSTVKFQKCKSLRELQPNLVRPEMSIKKLNNQTIKLLEEKIGGKLFDINLGDNFLDQTLKAKATNQK